MSFREPKNEVLSRARTPEDKAKVRDAFIAAGRRLLAEGDPSRVSLRMIAAEAGYAPGAIYQYDRGSSMITSVAALLSPGFTVGQQLPMGYSTYNVPYAYRSTYYDTPNAWYRYNNGYIYQVDPTTQLVSAIVASILT